MQIKITLRCPNCQSTKIKKNGKKINSKQNYMYKSCHRQFIGDHALSCKGCHLEILRRILLMPVRGIGIRDVSVIEGVLSVPVKSKYIIAPKQTHYESLEVDEFRTYVEKKSNKVWLIYAYDRASGEIVAYIWGKRDLKTARLLRKKLSKSGVTFTGICTDDWKSFSTAFNADSHVTGKENTAGIEGNNCRLRHRIRRAFRRTCCFSKKMATHFKAFDLAFFYINYGYV
jgi:IS1 family transposase